MKKILFLAVLVLLFLAGDLEARFKGDFLITDVSTYSVTGASGAGISTTTTSGVTDPQVLSRIAIRKVILTNGTTTPYKVHFYEYTTLTDTTTISGRITFEVGANSTAQSQVDVDFLETDMPIIQNILVRKESVLSGVVEAGVVNGVSAYILYR